MLGGLIAHFQRRAELTRTGYPITRKELEYRIVSVCERFPDARWRNRDDDREQYDEMACLMYQVADDIGVVAKHDRRRVVYGGRGPLAQFIYQARNLNDNGVRWGDIPLRLGLVPGPEQVEVATQNSVLTAPNETVESSQSCATDSISL